ncbi:MAG TPA: prolipoprotein diacylglyceryl transferase family protein, partial [Terriglobales bacterium]|nr:prolipoprotein diacylglyceryl transferase family protein [Terriglobales bacterium]
MLPKLFDFGSFFLPTYGVIAAAGLILGLMLNIRLAVRDGLDEEKSWNLGIVAILSAILGSKILLIVIEWKHFSNNWRTLLDASFIQSAGVYYGGLIGALLASVIYMKLKGMPILRTCDAFAPGVAFGHGLGRLGCFAAGCCYGRPTDLPWGITFTNPWAQKSVGTPLNVSLHPAQLYEFLTEMLITFVLLALWKRKQFPGQVF